jgi:SAM-dependent methyltransferase
LLLDAGLEAGDRYVEFGCGLGYVTGWATAIGTDALGIDLSADQIATATELAEGTTEFRVGSVYDHGLPPDSVDVSYSRWLLMHLNRPVEAMRSIYAALKPGGLMVCEEADMSEMYAEPPPGTTSMWSSPSLSVRRWAWTTRAVVACIGGRTSGALRWSASMRISRTTSRERTRDSEPGRTARPEPTSSERWDD